MNTSTGTKSVIAQCFALAKYNENGLLTFKRAPKCSTGVKALYKFLKRSNFDFSANGYTAPKDASDICSADATALKLIAGKYAGQIRDSYYRKLDNSIKCIETSVSSSSGNADFKLTADETQAIKAYLNGTTTTPCTITRENGDKQVAWFNYHLSMKKSDIESARKEAAKNLQKMEKTFNAALIDEREALLNKEPLDNNSKRKPRLIQIDTTADGDLFKTPEDNHQNDLVKFKEPSEIAEEINDRKLVRKAKKFAFSASVGLAVGEGIVPGFALYIFLAAVNLPLAIGLGVACGLAGFIANKLLIEDDAESIYYALRKKVTVLGEDGNPVINSNGGIRQTSKLFIDDNGKEVGKKLKGTLGVGFLLAIGTGLCYGALAFVDLQSTFLSLLTAAQVSSAVALPLSFAALLFPAFTIAGMACIYAYVTYDLVKEKRWEAASAYIKTKYFAAPWKHMSGIRRLAHVASSACDILKQVAAVGIALIVVVIAFPIFKGDIAKAITMINRVFSKDSINTVAKGVGFFAATINATMSAVFGAVKTLSFFSDIKPKGIVKGLMSLPILAMDLALSTATLRFIRIPMGLASPKETAIQRKALNWISSKVDRLFNRSSSQATQTASGIFNTGNITNSSTKTIIQRTRQQKNISDKIAADGTASSIGCTLNGSGQAILFATGGSESAKQVASSISRGHGTFGIVFTFLCAYVYSYGPNALAAEQCNNGGRVALTAADGENDVPELTEFQRKPALA